MNQFLLKTSDRLSHWKEFRRSLSSMDATTQLTAVAEYWSRAPLVTIAYDPSDASTWPTPWEMIKNNKWCRSSVAIGMENTLRLSDTTFDTALLLIIDRDIQAYLLILMIDGQWVLNYDWGVVLPYPKTNHSVLKTWKFVGKAYTLLNG